MESSETITETASAKLNLSLRILRQRADGYHILDSLVGFVALSDTLHARKSPPNAPTRLRCKGAFAAQVPTDETNLVLRAHQFISAYFDAPFPTAFALEKNLPIASGLGGGSSDAAAAMRALARLYGLNLDDIPRAMLAELGADIPLAMNPAPTHAMGIGEILTPLPPLPDADIVLANPRIALSTRAVYGALDATEKQQSIAPPTQFPTLDALTDFLRTQDNDLMRPALKLCPQIGDVLSALKNTAPAYSAMSGSGATCFALYALGQGASAAAHLRENHPEWWIAQTRWLQ